MQIEVGCQIQSHRRTNRSKKELNNLSQSTHLKIVQHKINQTIFWGAKYQRANTLRGKSIEYAIVGESKRKHRWVILQT